MSSVLSSLSPVSEATTTMLEAPLTQELSLSQPLFTTHSLAEALTSTSTSTTGRFNLNLYFSGSIAGGMEDGPLYHQIIAFLQTKGRVFTEHLWNEDLHASLKQGIYPAGMEYLSTDTGTYQQDIEWVEASHLVVAEVSTPSIGVGIEIAHAQSRQIPVICLYREGSPKRISAMVAGNPGVRVIRYCTIEDLLPKLAILLEQVMLAYRSAIAFDPNGDLIAGILSQLDNQLHLEGHEVDD